MIDSGFTFIECKMPTPRTLHIQYHLILLTYW